MDLVTDNRRGLELPFSEEAFYDAMDLLIAQAVEEFFVSKELSA